MSYHTEIGLDHTPGTIFSCLDCGGMLLDRDSGEYLPADQVIRDPLHINQLDILDEGHLGCLKLGLCDDETMTDDGELGEGTDDSFEDAPTENRVDRFLSEQEELSALIAAQEADLSTGSRITCTKGSHREIGTDKLDGGRLYKRGRNNSYKNHRRQATIW